jgi:tRNA-specific 2-thiouridylase
MGTDRTKDQSYFLYASPRAWLDRLLFPLGESTKTEVRAEAIARALPGAQKGESQELCFVGQGTRAYADFVQARAGKRVRPGPIVDETGRTVGRHDGVHRFTIGQRKGLGVALGRPAFVRHIDAQTATVHLGSDSALGARGATLADVSLGEGISLPVRARVRIRYRHEGDDAVVVDGAASPPSIAKGASFDPVPLRARITFDHPVRAVTRGQIAVLYRGDRVIGGGRIVETTSDDPPGSRALSSSA